MPTNLPAEARAKWVKVMEAKTPEEKLRALEEFLSLIPKHKGTEKLRAHVKRQMVRLREEIERKQRKQSRRREGELVAKEGDIQAVLIGYPNTGKSLFTSLLTNVKAISTPTPFETRKPQPAMLFCNGISVQLVDTPSLVEGGGRINSVVFTLARNADVILLFIDALIDPLAQLKKLVQELEGARIKVGRFEGLVRVKKKATGGIEIKGEVQRFSKADVEKFLKSYGIYHAEVEVEGRSSWRI
ncbi:MAG: hypothetical protein DRJ51_06090 [Thermoprotei archaeon]|nr:MAG: hypothetical protein DRJ51_06090 [Thermoprotei archaeon]